MEGFKNMDPAQLLAEVDRAIISILQGGQSYRIGTRSLTRANLTELRNLKTELEAQASKDSAPGLIDRTSVAIFDGR
ncbi:hypothetical protein [Intestinibacillus massiliensis]|uniref:hypothetical protein n=1 Tax=Intestinibacillus massiliensis TaxID=1871029 RepID=UPI000B355D2C|nr:hypothetical protein [Intestinibacillus massiliensis]